MQSVNVTYGIPVCITEVATGSKVEVKYSQLNESDWQEELLNASTSWGSCDYAHFFEVWAEPSERMDVWKAILATESDPRMQGILYLASNGPRWPEGCVLITAPWNRYQSESRKYLGVGTVLIAFLIEESIRRNQQGALRFQIDPNAQGFYEWLGFAALDSKMPDYYTLEPHKARDILQRVRCRFAESRQY